jgi:hypothetical protein
MSRLIAHLAAATRNNGNPHPVLRPFAVHLQNHILTPSARFASPDPPHARTGLAGCFTYEPPQAAIWSL